MKIKDNCVVCGTEIENEICCDGYMCGCLGMPINPSACSDKCYEELKNNKDKYYSKTTTPINNQ